MQKKRRGVRPNLPIKRFPEDPQRSEFPGVQVAIFEWPTGFSILPSVSYPKKRKKGDFIRGKDGQIEYAKKEGLFYPEAVWMVARLQMALEWIDCQDNHVVAQAFIESDKQAHINRKLKQQEEEEEKQKAHLDDDLPL